MSVENKFNDPALILFPDGMLFPANITELFSVSDGRSLTSLNKVLVGSHVISSTYRLMKVNKIILSKEKGGTLPLAKRILLKRLNFTVELIDVINDVQAVLEFFKVAAVQGINLEHNNLCISVHELSKINNPRDLYNSFRYPRLDECLDRL